ncbi:MAG: xanthine dehydrogenase family protein subunit M [Myxococcota bacterium]|nr:xanthine dehydrogenase family protein subunit M [Myxococcota bacterium]
MRPARSPSSIGSPCGRVFRATLRPFEHHGARTVAEALALLARYRGRARLLAGGTDVVVRMKLDRERPEALVDIKRVAALGGPIRLVGGSRVAIPALARLADLTSSALLRRKLPVLAEAASLMASPQVRNRATIGGNLANAAPSADMAPPLIALGASVRVHSRRGVATVPLDEFFLGPGETVLGRSKVLGAILVPLPPRGARAIYRTHTVREAMDISIASVAIYVERRGRTIRRARIALGAVAPIPLRVREAERALEGTDGGAPALAAASVAAAHAARPIDDVRGSADYRREIVRVLVRRALEEAPA